jgi:hypothetical protein
MIASRLKSEESGMTIIELVIGMAMGMVVLGGLSMMFIVVIHGTARVDARVEATDTARVAVARITEELHSACVSPQIAPVQTGSSGTTLIFWHAGEEQSEAVQPIPVKTKIAYSNGKLTQTDYAKTGGSSPNWTFEPETAGKGTTRILLTNVAPGLANGNVFAYGKYENGEPKALKSTGLEELEAKFTVLVTVGLKASPISKAVADAGSTATVQDSATLRLTPPTFNQASAAPPCQ